MGWPSLPVYGNADLGSAIETIENAVSKIKTNKFDKSDLEQLHSACVELEKAINESEN